MKSRVYLIVLLLLLPLQASLFGPLSLGGITPDLGLAVLYCIGLMTGPVEAALAGIAIGLLQDIGSASLIGFSGLTRGIVGLVAGFLGRRVLDIQSPTNIVFLVLFCLAESLFSALFLEITYGSVPLVGLFFGRIVPRAVTTAMVGYALLRFTTGKNVLAWMRRRELQKEH
jgi:rod shape-determining protein MreD